MRKETSFRTAVVAAVLALAGCDGSAATDPPTSAVGSALTETATETAPPAGGAPRVADPLDATRLLDRPRAALTDDQLDGFGVEPAGEPNPDAGVAETVGPSCAWTGDGTRDGITVLWYAEDATGLAGTYGHRDEAAYFEEATVGGLPAVFVDWMDTRAAGACRIVVGVSDTLSFGLGATAEPDQADACDRAEQAATAVVQNLRRD